VKRGVEFKVILTNHRLSAGKVISLHEGRGRPRESVWSGEKPSAARLHHLPQVVGQPDLDAVCNADPQPGARATDGALCAAQSAGDEEDGEVGV
jgi:hypothetical protein